jgi:hypothetical protein
MPSHGLAKTTKLKSNIAEKGKGEGKLLSELLKYDILVSYLTPYLLTFAFS